MACVVTDKIEFEVIPPAVSAETPVVLRTRPSVPDTEFCSRDGLSFSVRFFNAQYAETDLQTQVFINGEFEPPRPPVIRSSAASGVHQFCIPFDEFTREPEGEQACYRVDFYVSHEFLPLDEDEPGASLDPNDSDRVTWFIGVPGTNPQPDAPSLWETCQALAAEPTQTLEAQGDGGMAP